VLDIENKEEGDSLESLSEGEVKDNILVDVERLLKSTEM